MHCFYPPVLIMLPHCFFEAQVVSQYTGHLKKNKNKSADLTEILLQFIVIFRTVVQRAKAEALEGTEYWAANKGSCINLQP